MSTTAENPKAKTLWIAMKSSIRDGRRVLGYVEVFRGPGGKYFTVPGASRFRDTAGNIREMTK